MNNHMADSEQHQVGLGASDYQQTSASMTNNQKDGEQETCTVESNCKDCSFKELQ